MSNITIDNNGKLICEDAKIMYRNFAGVGTDYNAEGARNFHLIIDNEALAQDLNDAGWNIKFQAPRDPQDTGTYHVKVNVNYRSNRGPRIWLHAGSMVRELNEQTVGELDTADILGIDMVVTPYNWTRPNGSGISGYLDTMHVVIKEDPFAHKYANLEG